MLFSYSLAPSLYCKVQDELSEHDIDGNCLLTGVPHEFPSPRPDRHDMGYNSPSSKACEEQVAVNRQAETLPAGEAEHFSTHFLQTDLLLQFLHGIDDNWYVPDEG